MGLWLSAAIFIIFVRDGIECLISTGGFAIPDAFHLLRVQIFFLSLLLFLIVILHFFAETEILKVSKIALILFSIIILPVLVDLGAILFSKTEITYGYITDWIGLKLLRFFDPTYKIPELPLSIRSEISLVTILSFGYILLKRKKAHLAILGALSTFLLCFLYAAAPAVLIEIFKFVAVLINILHLKNFPLPEAIIDENIVVLLELFLASFLALIWLWRYDRGKCRAVIKNMRLTRSFHYVLLCFLGALVSCASAPIKDFFALIRVAGAFSAIFFAFQFSVVINDFLIWTAAGSPTRAGHRQHRAFLNTSTSR
ncbi:MAG: hypothetical protein AUJ74_00945 [Candidatus Omnitrophica bacterium CG1_02_44_16]|nr:MAG: hypothetical protein AUJ74_00945 [Candidatus Omnitrophica bacterium CG1_02_44_16]